MSTHPPQLNRPGRLRLKHLKLCQWLVITLATTGAFTCRTLAEGETTGIPWTGKSGVSETVGEIMSRAKQVLPGADGPGELKKHA